MLVKIFGGIGGIERRLLALYPAFCFYFRMSDKIIRQAIGHNFALA